MKFVTLALAVLLTVGCQAASLQADAPAEGLPTYLQHGREYMRMAMNQIKDSVHNIAKGLGDEETKAAIIARADSLYDQAVALQAQVAPMTDSAVATISEATADLRASIKADVEALQRELEPMRASLRDVVEKHVAEYKALLNPIMTDIRANQEEQMRIWKPKLEPVMEELRGKIAVNVEETKSKLVPIIETVRAKLGERVESVKVMLTPYMDEYKEQLKSAYSQAQSANYDELRQKMEPHFATLKTSFEGLAQAVRDMAGAQ